MTNRSDSALALVEKITRRAPQLIDLIAAETEGDFDEALDALLERAIIGLETDSKKFASFDEDTLSSILALAMSVPGISVSRELHSNGHVDLTVEVVGCSPSRKRLGEAKIYGGPENHIGGLAQLLTRYSTGREGRGFVIAYVKRNGIAQLMKKIRERMDSDMPIKQVGATSDHSLKWSFLSRHQHECGEELAVMHIGCNLFACGTAAAAQGGID